MSGRTAAGQSALFALRKIGGKHPAIEEQLVAAGFPEHEAEYHFAVSIGRKWAFDFAFVEWKVSLEIEGGGFGRYLVIQQGYERRRGQTIPLKPGTVVRAGGRHNTGEGMSADIEKYNAAQLLGWMVLRATTTDVRDGTVVDIVRRGLEARGWNGGGTRDGHTREKSFLGEGIIT